MINKRAEGFIKTRGGRVWFEIVGDKNKTPLIALHGGPGYPHDSLVPLEQLSDTRKVIYYDQLGCGNSQKVKDKKLWSLKYFTEELGVIIKELALKEYILLGHSWGAALAVSFALTKPHGLKGLILSSPYISTPHWEADAARLISKFPKTYQKALKDPKSKDYRKASDEFYFKHLYRTKNIPTASLKANFKMNVELYNYMWGPEEFRVTGTLKKLDLSKKLNEINIQTLLPCGRFDEATPESTEYFTRLMPNAKMHVFERSAHMSHWTEQTEYISTVRKFLNNL